MKTANPAAGSKKSGEALSRPDPDTPRVLSDLRTSWLVDNAPNASRKPAKRRVRLGEKLEIIAEEVLRLLAGLKAMPRALAGFLRRSCDGLGDRAADAAIGAPGLILLFVFVVVMGALLYSMTVQHIFNSGNSGGSLEGPRTALPSAASAKSSDQTEDVATKLGSDRAGSVLADRAAAYVDKLAERVESPALPTPAALASAADSLSRKIPQYEPAAPVPALEKAVDWADAGNTPKEGATQPRKVESTQKTSDTNAPAPKRTQGMAATGGQGDVGVTAQRATPHGGDAVFEVRHFDVATGAWHPARIVVTATALEFVPQGPCETGALKIPLKAIRSVQVGQSSDKPAVDLLNIEVGEQKHGAPMRRLSLSGPLPNAGGSSTAHGSAFLTNIRQVILTAQGRL